MAGFPTPSSLFVQRVVIGVGDLAVSNNSQVTLSTYALGSCVAVIAYDPTTRAGGILHLMLPDSSLSPDKAAKQPAMFADTGVPLFLRALAGVKAESSRLRIFLAGGACVLSGPDTFKIGERNAASVKTRLSAAGLRITGDDLGGTVNRTVHLDLSNAGLSLKMPNRTDQYSLA